MSYIKSLQMRTCDLDGIRIDASQTVDWPFLKQIKNRINIFKEDAIVLRETLCDLNEAVDIPVDMIYGLLVDFHRDAEYADQYIDFLKYTSGTFAPRTLAMTYFENHDSPRAIQIWKARYRDLLQGADTEVWKGFKSADAAAQTMALLRNLQCSLIDATAGNAHQVNMAYDLECCSEWGEEDIVFERIDVVPAFDRYEYLAAHVDRNNIVLMDAGISVHMQPLQSIVVKMAFRSL